MKRKGYIIIEVLLSLTLLSIVLIPMTNKIKQYIKLKNYQNRIENLEFREIKLEYTKGYIYNKNNGKKVGLGTGFGDSKKNIELIFLKEKDKITKILTPYTEYTNCE